MFKKFLVAWSLGSVAALGLWLSSGVRGEPASAYAQPLPASKKASPTTVQPKPLKQSLAEHVPEPLQWQPGKIWPPPTPRASLDSEIFAEASTRNAAALFDGRFRDFGWQAGKPSATPKSKASPPWAAVKLKKSYARILVHWTASGNSDYNQTTYGAPGSYAIELSENSTQGEDGKWRRAIEVHNNRVRTRSHVVELRPGEVFLRFVVRAEAADCYSYGVQIDELSIFDMGMCRQGFACDTWAFVGDSITAMSFDNAAAHRPGFADAVQEGDSRRTPVVLNGGIGGENVAHIEQRIERMLDDNPAIYYWAIGIGSNDSAGNNTQTQPFRQSLERVVKHIVSKGRMPILARIPYASDGQHETIPAFNKEIDELTKKYQLPVGPDLYMHFKNNPQQLADGLHPTDEGIIALQSLWAQTALGLKP
ncbi:MAG: SGNH/GDSL hydrolase family protein [Cystobacterineae bacterium]|nr:SGNH/GDSL hydrolase family protein [Cystobacterineae bacterium]